MPPGSLTLIGSGEFSERMLNVYHALLGRLSPPQIVFLDTPAGFQLNADELNGTAAAYFKKHFALDLGLARYRRADEDPAPVLAQLQTANCILAGPGSPSYALRHWRGTPVWAAVVERWRAGAHLVFASSAAIALGRWALPVYEIYKVGADPYWDDGLDLLGPHGLALAILPHYNNAEGRTHDTRYCFIGEPRLAALERQLPPEAVILGLDEHTACTFDFESQTFAAAGPGQVTGRYRGKENRFSPGTTVPLDRLTPLHASQPVSPGEPPPLAGPAGASMTPARTVARHDGAPGPAATARPAPPVPEKVREWAAERDRLRAEKNFAAADALRDRMAAAGYAVKDSPAGPQFSLTRYASAGAVPSRLDSADTVDWSVNLIAHNNRDEILRAARSALQWGAGHSFEVVIVDDASDDGTAEAIAALASEAGPARVRPVLLAARAGEGAGRNAGFRASGGRHILILGGHMEITGQVFDPLAATLADDAVGATGSNGLVSKDLFTFEPAPTVNADALEFYLFAFRRERLKRVGLLDEKFVFYRNLDLDWSLAFKDKGLRLVTTPDLPLAVHEHPYLRMDPAERDRLSKKNYRRFLDKWRDRKDLLLVNA